MKVLMISGSPHPSGVTHTAFMEMKKVFEASGVETEIVQVGHLAVNACKACKWCRKKENARCIQDDIVNELAIKFAECDALVVGTPVHHGSASGPLITVMDRLFYSTKFIDRRMKVGASITTARRSGCTSTFDELNKYFLVSGMTVAGGQYWNNLFGDNYDEAIQDKEGMQTMRTLANNIIFLMKAIKDAKEKYGLPELEDRIVTNFIRN